MKYKLIVLSLGVCFVLFGVFSGCRKKDESTSPSEPGPANTHTNTPDGTATPTCTITPTSSGAASYTVTKTPTLTITETIYYTPSITQTITPNCHVCTAVATVADAGLIAKMKEAIGIDGVCNICVEDLNALTTLDASSAGISDLTGLRNCGSLQNLNLENNSLDTTDVNGVLRYMSTVTNMNIGGNSGIDAISGLGPIAGVISDFSIHNTCVSDISVLANFSQLKYLSAYNCSVGDISALSNGTKMEELYLQNNSISDISPLITCAASGGFSNPGSIIDVSENPLDADSQIELAGLKDDYEINVTPEPPFTCTPTYTPYGTLTITPTITITATKTVTPTVTHTSTNTPFVAEYQHEVLPDAGYVSTEDAFAAQGYGIYNVGLCEHIQAGYDGTPRGLTRGFIKMDISDLPDALSVDSATLTLHCLTFSGSITVRIYRVLTDWDEGTGHCAFTYADGVCWEYADYPAAVWTSAGGDYNAAAVSDAVVLSAFEPVISFNLDASMIEEWAGGINNCGIMIMLDPPENNGYIQFFSNNWTHNLSDRPKLTVNYYEP